MIKAEYVFKIFEKSVEEWHINNSPFQNPFEEKSMEYILYAKNQIDNIQWHIEDEVRRPDIADSEVVKIKRQIDSLNQKRTDLVEELDDYFFNQFKNIKKIEDARMNSETPAWLLDRMSILELKIYHMKEQTERTDATEEHISTCKKKLEILLEQKKDLSICLDQLLEDLQAGKKFMKVYRQMKMYNDANLNPALYKNKK